MSAGARVRKVIVANVPVDDINQQEALEAIDRMLSRGGQHHVAVVNAAKLVLANRDPELREILLAADIVTADGMSVLWASKLLGCPLRERVTGIDLFERLVARAAERGLSVYFLGAREESVQKMVTFLLRRYPKLSVSGYRNGYFDWAESAAIAEAICQSGAEILFVALGSPAQEKWIAANLARTGAKLAMGVGGSFDHMSGLARRAPKWMQRAGLEWFYRLLREPRRLWKRYLIGNLAFAWLIAKQLFRK
jgi:N-acetylglucosaminyldiphosphoundecaprenol N-acetyl-beta-D-mannosaminyltransferase